MKIDLRSLLLILLIVSLLNSGCRDSGSSTAPAEKGGEALDPDLALESDGDAKLSEGAPFDIDHDIDYVYGPWLFYITSNSQEVPLGELRILVVPGTDPPQLQAEIAALNQDTAPQIVGLKVQPDSLEVTYAVGPQIQIFEGRLQDGIVYGNLIGGKGICTPARLIRPKETLAQEPTPHLVEGVHDFSEIMKEGSDWDRVVKFIQDHPESPLIPNAFYELVMQIRPREISTQKVEAVFELIDQYAIRWGERLKNFVRLNSLLQLANDYRHPDLVESIRASLEGEFEEPVWSEQVDFFMENLEKDVELSRLVEAIRDADEQERVELLERLQQEVKSNRFNVKLLVSTAEVLAEADDRQAAIDWYLKLVVVPGLEDQYLGLFGRFADELQPPSSRLAELWEKVHGSPEGLQAALDREYEELLSGYEIPEYVLPDPNGKQVLVELFTGTSCPPCVAADLAFALVRDRLPQDRVVMLQYHVHVPGPDPLTCKECSGRYGYYNPKGTPATLVNGRMFEGWAGSASDVPRVLQPFLDEIIEELALDPLMQIDVQVTPDDDGTAAFAAAVKADEISDRWRLHVALAEGEVKYQGPNGVPVHQMVVRKLYTSSQGQEPTDGSLELKGTIEPGKIRHSLKQELEAFRKSRSVRFEDGPLDLDDLFLVVFVQDARNRRVRQVVSVPVPSASSVSSASE